MPDLARGAADRIELRIVADAGSCQSLAVHLIPEERARAGAIVAPLRRAEFVAGRGALRALLGRMLGVEPRDVPIAVTEKGKPELGGSAAGHAHFSISHAGGMVVLAFLREHAVGVDIERRRRIEDVRALRARYFAAASTTDNFIRDDTDIVTDEFLRLWTAAEAFAKASGQGLAEFGDHFPVRFADHARRNVQILDRERPSAQRQWRVQSLDLGPDYVGTVVIDAAQDAPPLRLSVRPHDVPLWQDHDAEP